MYSLVYTESLEAYIDGIVKRTGLQRSNPEHIPLIQMYTVLAMKSGKDTTESDIHDVWSLWTLLTRNNPKHKNLVAFDKLDDRTKALDKVDLWAVHETSEVCG